MNIDSAVPSTPLEDIAAEAARILASAGDLRLRLLGGLAIEALTPDAPLLHRTYRDIDFASESGQQRPIESFFGRLGYSADERFNQMNGRLRLLFYDPSHDRKVDVFVGAFMMCHTLPIKERLAVHPATLPPADLLLTKLQIFALNEKDRVDVINLLYHLPLTPTDDGINFSYIAQLCGRDWGLHRTVSLNLDRVEEALGSLPITLEQQTELADKLAALRHSIDQEPKTRKWRMRARIGERVRWYEDPEEID